MSETGGLDIGVPSEGGSGAPEQLSEEARQRFAAAAAAMQAIRREEKRSKKRDSRVAKTILQFLQDDRYTHLFVLISRLVARDCPSIFILAVLSLIHDECRVVTEEYLKEGVGEEKSAEMLKTENLPALTNTALDPQTNHVLVAWIMRMQMVMSLDAAAILQKLMLDEKNIDGTVLQLTTFVVQDFFQSRFKKPVAFETLNGLSASILQTVFEPFLDAIEKKLLAKPANGEDDDDEDDDD